ncbi:hypothetical protein [Silvibacterium sp.]|uniref:hypothetical protein n=1 Tax=Silvibacterium sp. TaxID=1964179 RepID=UPI0039E3C256
MVSGTWNNTGRRTVVGYFSNAEDANNAIQDLITAGFRSSSLGAAFPGTSTDIDTEIRPAVGPNAPGAGTTVSGPASGSSAVTPAGLSTGAGTVNTGASRPGPITGSDIPSELPSTLPHTIQSTLPSTLHPNPNAPVAGAVPAYPATGVSRDTVKPSSHGKSWSERLKNVFGGEERRERVVPASPVDKTSQNFGTGEGHLGVYPEADYSYSDAAFESAFFGMGLEPSYAHQLAGRLGSGGAIVTIETLTAVEAGQAESLMERNHGSVRMDTMATIPAASDLAAERRMQLFGRVRSVYPGYVSSGMATRKAS